MIINAASDRHRQQMQAMLDFFVVDSIEYIDLGNGEDYIFTKGDKKLRVKARGNRDQGGFLCVDCGLKPLRME